jgi:hypothetical protein
MTENGWNWPISPKSHAFAHGCSKLGKGENVASGERLKRLAAVSGKPEHWFFMDEGSGTLSDAL